MAKEGKKLELYEILAAKRAKGKMPPAFESRQLRQANSPDEEESRHQDPYSIASDPASPGVIIDDAVAEAMASRQSPAADEQTSPSHPPPVRRESQSRPRQEGYPKIRETQDIRVVAPQSASPQPQVQAVPQPDPPPRPRTTREVVFALDTAFIFLTVVLALLGSSYFLGYKRGQEERPTGIVGAADIEVAEPGHINLRHLAPAPRSAVRPSETDYTLILRTEPVTDDLPERLELELAEAVSRGRQTLGTEVQGYIYRTGGNDPRYVLAVGLCNAANDAELNRLLQVYNKMEGISLAREPRPYIGCRIAPVRELGTLVY